MKEKPEAFVGMTSTADLKFISLQAQAFSLFDSFLIDYQLSLCLNHWQYSRCKSLKTRADAQKQNSWKVVSPGGQGKVVLRAFRSSSISCSECSIACGASFPTTCRTFTAFFSLFKFDTLTCLPMPARISSESRAAWRSR